MRAVTEIFQSRELPCPIRLYFRILASNMAVSNLQADQQLYSVLQSAYTEFLARHSTDPLHVVKDRVIKLGHHAVRSSLPFVL